jgi:hypothetical protein
LAQVGFFEEPPENEQSMLIFADFRVQQAYEGPIFSAFPPL